MFGAILAEWLHDVPTNGHRDLPPDPGLMRALGHNHSLETALADLVDNAIDAQATNVLVRFVRDSARLLNVCVVDNGHGMPERVIDEAMTVARRREYAERDLGHFGLGLKAASLGQANAFLVCSRSQEGVVGRRWSNEQASDGFRCDIVEPSFCATLLDHDWGFSLNGTGTVIRWDEVREFPRSARPQVLERYLEAAVLRVRQHLGLVFHRLLARDRVRVFVDVEDAHAGLGLPYRVEPIDPFGYTRSGHASYPVDLPLELEHGPLTVACHIWPGRSQAPSFKLPGTGTPESRQGFYFYRHDRLIQVGGWNGVTHPERGFQLARVAVDLDGDLGDVVRLNPEKTSVEVSRDFVTAVDKAASLNGRTFQRYLEDVKLAFRESQRRKRARAKVVPPGRGIDALVRRRISRELEYLPGEREIAFLWGRLPGDTFFDIDYARHVVTLNRKYRPALGGRGLNDAPLVKACLYLLVEELFRGSYLGVKDRNNLELWQSILTQAAQREVTR